MKNIYSFGQVPINSVWFGKFVHKIIGYRREQLSLRTRSASSFYMPACLLRYTDVNEHIRLCKCVWFLFHVDIGVLIYVLYGCLHTLRYTNLCMTCILIRMQAYLRTHACTCKSEQICVRRMQILQICFSYNICQALYMFTPALDIHGWSWAIPCRWECD